MQRFAHLFYTSAKYRRNGTYIHTQDGKRPFKSPLPPALKLFISFKDSFFRIIRYTTLFLSWLLTELDSIPLFDTTNSKPFPWFDFLLNLTLLNIGFHGASATGVACWQGTLTPPDTWSCPTHGLASILILRPISPKLVLFPDFWVSNIPRYFWFCLIWRIRIDILFLGKCYLLSCLWEQDGKK